MAKIIACHHLQTSVPVFVNFDNVAWFDGDSRGTTLHFATGIKELVVNEAPDQLKAWVSTAK
jgi:hypothetical protein